MAPSPSQQIALNLLLAQQQDRSSPNYHKWLTPGQFAERFGVSQGDINKITAWLESQGFQVFGVPRGRNSVGSAARRPRFKALSGPKSTATASTVEKHIANSTPVEVPAALNGVVTGVRGLTDFHPKPMYVRPLRDGKIGHSSQLHNPISGAPTISWLRATLPPFTISIRSTVQRPQSMVLGRNLPSSARPIFILPTSPTSAPVSDLTRSLHDRCERYCYGPGAHH